MQRKMNKYDADLVRVTASISEEDKAFWERLRRTFGVAVAAGVVLAVISPLGTDVISFLPRLAYWEIIMVCGASLSIGVTEAMVRSGRLRSQPWIGVALATFLISLPLTFIVIAASRIFYGTESTGLARYLAFYGMTFTICFAVHSAIFLAGRSRNDRPIKSDASVDQLLNVQLEEKREPRASLFARRLPGAYQQLAISALQAEDHFLRVHFETGQSVLIRARLSDAIHELPDEDGAQTHRSWWVARAAIRKVIRTQGRISLNLRCGIEAPVSRTFYRHLSGSGWFASLAKGDSSFED